MLVTLTSRTKRFRAFGRFLTTTSLIAICAFAVSPASAARETLNFSSPFEVSDSPAGNYLAALIAGADHDTTAAATFFR